MPRYTCFVFVVIFMFSGQTYADGESFIGMDVALEQFEPKNPDNGSSYASYGNGLALAIKAGTSLPIIHHNLAIEGELFRTLDPLVAEGPDAAFFSTDVVLTIANVLASYKYNLSDAFAVKAKLGAYYALWYFEPYGGVCVINAAFCNGLAEDEFDEVGMSYGVSLLYGVNNKADITANWLANGSAIAHFSLGVNYLF